MRGRKLATLLSLTTSLIFASTLHAASLQVTWKANTETDLAGYNIYFGKQSRTYPQSISAGKAQTSLIITGLDNNTQYFVTLTAFDTSMNESGYSNEAFAKTLTIEEEHERLNPPMVPILETVEPYAPVLSR